MKKLILSLLVLTASVMPSSAQLLYRISGNGLQKDSYIIGTCHIADASFVDQIPGAKDALNSVDQVYGELPMADMLNADSIAVLQSFMMLPEGQTIKDVMTAEQFERLDSYVEKSMGIKLSNPMLYGEMSKMSPAAIENTLDVLICIKKNNGQFNPQNGIDNYFQVAALQMGKNVGGFESVYFQAHVLLGKSIEEQLKSLMCMVDNSDFTELATDELIKAYYAQDLEKVTEVMNMKLGNDCDSTPEDEATLIYNRNDNWVKQMPAVMAERSTFFAFGAAHLGGERGVLTQLKALGYTVEGVK